MQDNDLRTYCEDRLKLRKEDSYSSQSVAGVDERIKEFLASYLEYPNQDDVPILDAGSFIALDKPGMARLLSLPKSKHLYKNDCIETYGLGEQGVLHNTRNDRRTTKNSFHIVEGGPVISGDKVAVPKIAFKNLLEAAFAQDDKINTIPYTAEGSGLDPVVSMAALALKVPVVPEVANVCKTEYLECRVFAPGGLVSNLDFLEEIFGNAGDVTESSNDLGQNPDSFTGVTSCIIFAPYLCNLTKKELGLPYYKDANERAQKEGMCWQDESELYNDGNPFKIVARDLDGHTITLISDNYFGYGKKTVKSDISYAANLRGMVLEEHAGGATVVARYNYGNIFLGEEHLPSREEVQHRTLDDTLRILGPMIMEKEGVYFDTEFPDYIYVPTEVEIDLNNQQVNWSNKGKSYNRMLSADEGYILPNGQCVKLEKGAVTESWKLVTSRGRNTIFHKPCTVSGGGKSEVSKSFVDVQGSGPLIIDSFHDDVEQIKKVLARNYTDRFAHGKKTGGRPILSRKRGLGSVIKLLTPSHEYSDSFNEYLNSIPTHIKQWVYHLKSVWREEFGDDWYKHYSVHQRDGRLDRELYFHGKKIILCFARVGYRESGTYRTFSLRWDYNSAVKYADQDDISISAIVPNTLLNIPIEGSSQISLNVEEKLFQRPDGCIHPGAEYESEIDIATGKGLFLVNFEPLTHEQVKKLAADVVLLEEYTQEMRDKIKQFASREEDDGSYLVVSSHFRRTGENSISKNPRYLQTRRDRSFSKRRKIAERCSRLYHDVQHDAPLYRPIDVCIPGRRLNPPGQGYPPLTVYGPVHYQELPELMMDYVASLSGKSPSTTGAGSEGALTKGPFNALPTVYDLNDFFVAALLTGLPTFSTPTGHIGPKYRIDHDLSYIMPEVLARMTTAERMPSFLIENKFLEKVSDYAEDHGRLGYRITRHFVNRFFGRVFSEPHQIFDPEMLRPELQGQKDFNDGIDNILKTSRKVSKGYIDDGSIELANPPIKSLLFIMAEGEYITKSGEVWESSSTAFRDQFTKAALLESDWYKDRLSARRGRKEVPHGFIGCSI